MRHLIVVPARGGSKGVPGKNFRLLGGIPLIAWSIKFAKQLVNDIDAEIVVSTDSAEIAEIAKKFGANVPFIRQAELATDDASTLSVMLDAIDRSSEIFGEFTHFLLLQPTCPFRSIAFAKTWVALQSNALNASIVSVADVDGNHPFRMKRLDSAGRLLNFIDQGFEDMRPRQTLPRCFIRSGSIYSGPVNQLAENRSLVSHEALPIIHSGIETINIDTELDFLTAQAAIDNDLWMTQQ